MDTLKTAVICLTEDEFYNFSKFQHMEGVNEFYHVTSTFALNAIDNLTKVVYLSSARDLQDYGDITITADGKGVTQTWR